MKSKNTFGSPIKLPSKLLAVIPDPLDEDGIYVAESAATVKRVSLSKRVVTHTFTGPAAPISCMCIHIEKKNSRLQQTLFGGCWDKKIWVWDNFDTSSSGSSPATIRSTRQLAGHTDFVKALAILAVPGLPTPLLISGGAESEILFWDLNAGSRLHVLKGHVRGILALQFDPSTLYSGTEAAVFYSASSDREIRATSIPMPPPGEVISTSTLKSLKLSPPLIVHETSVYSLHFDPDGSGLWTASADKSAKHFFRKDPEDNTATDGKTHDLELRSRWEQDTSLTHPDFVRAAVSHPQLPFVVTAGRDEEVYVWNSLTGNLLHTYTGHYEEVTGLCIRSSQAISVSIDGTVRTWGLSPEDFSESRKEIEKWKNGVKDEEDGATAGESLLTEEEERELAELMAED